MELKNKVVSGFLWSATERFGSLIIQGVVSIILARLLNPSDFGLISILMVFSVVAATMVDSGFTQALIRKLSPTQSDYSTVFYINMTVAVSAYIVLTLLSYPIAEFYAMPGLQQIAPVLFLNLILNATGLIQYTVLTKQMNFEKIAKFAMVGNVVSAVVSVYMAYTGWGVWALVWQMLISNGLRNAMFWFCTSWRPSGRFSMESARELFGFGSKIFATSVINQIFTNISQLFIGRIYSPAQLGFYYQSQKLKELMSSSISQSVLNVSYPALASLQDDNEKLKQASRKVIIVLSFLLFPTMVGLICTADELFLLVLKEKWMPAVPYFKIFCLTGLLVPALNVCLNILKVKGKSGLILRLEFIKKGVALAVILLCVGISVEAVVWAQVVFLSFEALLNAIYTGRYIGYTLWQQMRDVLPYAAIAAVMYGVLMLLPHLMGSSSLPLVLIAKVVVGAGIYIGLSRLFKLEGWRETIEIASKLIGKS